LVITVVIHHWKSDIPCVPHHHTSIYLSLEVLVMLLELEPKSLPNQSSTLLDLLCNHVENKPNKRAYTFLKDGEQESDYLTYSQLSERAKAIAVQILILVNPGDRALLLYPPGLNYITAFLGCLYAGVVAVPAYPPRPNRSADRLQSIAVDAEARLILTQESLLSDVQRWSQECPALVVLNCLATDVCALNFAHQWERPKIDEQTLAFLQYTSGSTGTPKGVMVSHGNLLHNFGLIQQGFEQDSQSNGVIWLPPYHDMGLIGGILQPLYLGFHIVLMSPMDFLRKPFNWLQAISNYQVNQSGGPNFAYDLCVNRISDEQRDRLDLSNWKVAFTGAESIRSETLDRFTKRFAPCGFKPEAWMPCYGMAESTLMVSSAHVKESPILKSVNATELTQNRVIPTHFDDPMSKTLVSCGRIVGDQKVVIVNPKTQQRCAPDEIGEIWISGQSVTQGYWGNPEKTQQDFEAYITNSSSTESVIEYPFLRTGDLGFIEAGELFVTGRLKNVLIIRGRNHYPQDIEETLEQSHAMIRPSSSAAFVVESQGQEKLVVVAEIERRHRPRRKAFKDGQQVSERRVVEILPEHDPNLTEVNSIKTVIEHIRAAIANEHGLQAYKVVLIKPGSLPKTSSGKIQHHACKNAFLMGTLDQVEE
jgi:acyl-CoA synthetase (AMP-forming)/AMP-acid ligase II